MARPVERITLTYDDLVQLPEDRQRYELFEGELQVTAAPNVAHQTAVTNLAVVLGGYIGRQHLGRLFVAPIDVILNDAETSVVEPDLVYVSRERRWIVQVANLRGSPDLVVEVLSPSSAVRDLNAKMQLYLRYQVRNYWIFDPGQREVRAHELDQAGYRLVSSARDDEEFRAAPFPDLVIPLADVWDQ